MPETPSGLPYPAATDPVANGAADIQALAEAIDARTTWGLNFPASPSDGDIHYLVNSVASPLYVWQMRYNAGSSSAYKWEFVGGSPWAANVGSSDAIGVASAWVWAPGGPSLAAPKAGDYDVSVYTRCHVASADTVWAACGGGATPTEYAAVTSSIEFSGSAALATAARIPGVPAASILGLRLFAGLAASAVASRTVRVQPFRLA